MARQGYRTLDIHACVYPVLGTLLRLPAHALNLLKYGIVSAARRDSYVSQVRVSG